MSRNLAASIRARLKQHADESQAGLQPDTHALRSGAAAVSPVHLSVHAHNFLLKGALLFSIWYDLPHRPTRDADLLGFGPDDIDSIVTTFREICRIPVEDGIGFGPTSVKGAEIRKEAGYGGVRIDLLAKLDSARITLQVNIGFGDAVMPTPEAISYRVLLDDRRAPQLRAYPKYTVVAEKFHAVCLLGMTNTRMKDYFDLWVLLGENMLDPSELRRAIETTFERRKMAIPASLPAGLGDAFMADAIKQTQWSAFLKKNRLDAIALADVVTRLRGEFHKIGVI